MSLNITNHNAFFRQLLFIGLLIFVGIIVFSQLSDFTGAFLGAITLYLVLRRSLFYFTEKLRWKSWVVSLLMILFTSLVLTGLGFLLFKIIASELPSVDTSKLLSQIKMLLNKVNGVLGFSVVPQTIIESSEGLITGVVSSAINTTYNFATNMVMMLFILYFMLLSGRVMEDKMLEYVPFSGKSLCLLKQEVKVMVFSNVVGIPVIMLAQGLSAFIIYWILGVHNLFFWAFITAICGLIPLVGTAIVWVPLAIYTAVSGEFWQGVVLVLYGVIVITNIDNLCRILLLKKSSNTHPLIVVFGVLLGIPLFGFWGIIFGPLLISSFLLLIKIYFREYKLIDATPDNAAEIREEEEQA